MSYKLLNILTRTPLHVGAGSSVGAIDMPIQRERHTLIPIIPGSSLKGVLRDLWINEKEIQRTLFGPEDETEHRAGNLLVGEARVLCFPVRSARGSFAWVTAPLALQRYARDSSVTLEPLNIEDDQCRAGEMIKFGSAVVLEEYQFKVVSGIPADVQKLLADFLPDDPLVASLFQRLAIVSDGILSHFCATACEVQQRIRIDDQTGTVDRGGLFNQENVPSETLFYAVIGERTSDGHLARVSERLSDMNGLIQLGGDETIGLGYCSVAMKGGAR